ncbi:MAG: hypothetical protein IKZ89_08845 [Bacteroidaceae bacterium]|nr:hypothetical protein [Bacteroidaceae bacterium]
MISNNCITRHIKHTILFLLLAAGTTPAWAIDITALSDITDMEGQYRLTSDVSGSGHTTITGPFNGTLEAAIDPTTHMPYKITNLSAPLFTTLTGTVKNIVLENVGISSNTGNTGAIACTANGAARIYNVGIISGSVGGTAYTGGLVGLLDGTARVINCYSFANITGGSVRAGIVGYNNYASKYNDLKTMVMNCMFYGDIATGSTIVPIYGGEEISNDYNKNKDSGPDNKNNRLNNYNYFLYEAPFSKNNTTANPIITSYNCALAAEERFLVRFEFYRHLLNSTRELAAWYATDSPTQSSMLKWVLDKSIAPYPILKQQGKYPSVVNYDPDYTFDSGQKVSRTSVTERNKGKNLGTLTVNISKPATPTAGQIWPSDVTIVSSITIPILDKDTANYNFNYRKIQLPYYNDVGDKNYTSNKVVTGWMITSMEGGTQGSYTETNYDYPNFNYADRSTYAKDLYSVSHRIFSQGGYFNVPDGVTAITIEPYWGKAAYLSDACYDRYGYNTTDNLTQVGGGQRYTNNTDCPLLTGEQKVYTTVSNALSALSGVTNPTVYDYAVVLVGNYHHHTTEGKGGAELSKDSKPFTIMSIDLNQDNEPDYCLIYRSGKNQPISPIRFDFITVPGMVMAHKMAQASSESKDRDLGIPGNCTPMGWFEITTTGLIRYGQFEHSYPSKNLAPVIFMGGVIDQFVANNTAGANGDKPANNNKTKFFLFGDNVWFKMLSNGTHMDNKSPTPHRPISLTGGDYVKLYLSGYFRPDATVCTASNGDNNAECYIDGGRFGEVAGAGQENVSGNVTWMVNHADMNSFYGGGIKASDANQITGNITTTIKNSHVNLFCGGPMFGDVANDKTVTTTATNCVFGTYFGAGFGGTSIYRQYVNNEYQQKNYSWNSWVNSSYDNSGGDNYRGKYYSGRGVSCGYEYEFFGGSGGNVARLYLKYASFSLAQCNDVSSTLTGCTVQKNYYGGGSLGAVVGDATSTLTDCSVYGSVFGAGFSATIPKASVFNLGGFDPIPNYNEKTGVYEPEGFPASSEFTWVHVNSLNNKAQALDGSSIKTTKDLSGLGTVSGNVTLTITGDSHIYGSVFGGGESSDVTGKDKTVTVTLGGNTTIDHDVFGGGDQGEVRGSTELNIIDE